MKVEINSGSHSGLDSQAFKRLLEALADQKMEDGDILVKAVMEEFVERMDRPLDDSGTVTAVVTAGERSPTKRKHEDGSGGLPSKAPRVTVTKRAAGPKAGRRAAARGDPAKAAPAAEPAHLSPVPPVLRSGDDRNPGKDLDPVGTPMAGANERGPRNGLNNDGVHAAGPSRTPQIKKSSPQSTALISAKSLVRKNAPPSPQPHSVSPVSPTHDPTHDSLAPGISQATAPPSISLPQVEEALAALKEIKDVAAELSQKMNAAFVNLGIRIDQADRNLRS